MENFKGTKGKWEIGIFSNTSVYVPGGATICQMLPTDFRQLSDIEQDEVRNEIKANALLISKALEFGERLEQLNIDLKILKSNMIDIAKTNPKAEGYPTMIQKWIDDNETLLKEATTI